MSNRTVRAVLKRFGDVLGTSKEMRRLFTILEKASPTDATVSIEDGDY